MLLVALIGSLYICAANETLCKHFHHPIVKGAAGSLGPKNRKEIGFFLMAFLNSASIFPSACQFSDSRKR